MASITKVIFTFSILLMVYATALRKLNFHDQLNGLGVRRVKEGRRGALVIDNETAAVYNDVIKNITRVNKVLEDLIKNYERIKRIYSSQEILSNEYSSDADISPLKRATITSSTPPSKDFVATAIFYSEEKNEKDDYYEDVPEVTSAVADQTNTNKKKENITEDVEKSQSTEETEKTTTKKSKTAKKTTPKERKAIKERKTTKDNLRTTVVTDISVTEKHVSITTPSVTTSKETEKEEAKNTSKVKSENQQDYSSGEGSSSIYLGDSRERVSDSSEEIYLDVKPTASDNGFNLNLKDSQSEPYVQVKAVVHTEDFSPETIWEDVKNKPLKLAKQEEILYTQYMANFRRPHFQETVKRSQPVSESVIEGVSTVKDRVLPTHSRESSEDEKTIAREQFKTKILRKAYGDACLKVVVKKCYKACKKASKDACRKYKCTGNFKNTFQLHSKRSCIKEFRENQQDSDKKDVKNPRNKRRSSVGFGDITANGYLAAACLPPPPQQQHQRRMANETSGTGVRVKLNILRDRFERECQKVSAGKCTIACRSASAEACTADKCVKGKLDTLKKECKRYCKWSYENKKHSSSSCESSDSDSDSSSSGSDSNLSISLEDKKKDGKKDEPKSKTKDRKKKRIVRGEHGPENDMDTLSLPIIKGFNVEKKTNLTTAEKRRRKSRRHNKK